MARRKRIPYDPPHLRKGKKGRRSGVPRRPDQIFMSRRMFLAKSGIVAAFSVLAAKLGYMQLIEGEKYRAAAVDNITQDEILKADRGVVYDRKGRELAVNERTWEVRLRPAQLPAVATPERARVLDQLINALNLPDALVLDPRAIPTGQEATVYARSAQLLGKILVAEETDQMTQRPFLSVPGHIVRVNGLDLEVYLYPDEAGRRADSVKIAADGQIIAGEEQDWPAPPRFAMRGNVLTLLVTPDNRLASRVDRAITALPETGIDLAQVTTMLKESGLAAWTAYIEDEKRYNYLVNLEDDLSTDLAALCRAHLNELPGVKVINRLEYLVENGGFAERIVVRRGVPREVALKLEANKLSLPGVELDGDVLTRRYPGGEAMSHILGYVGQVSEADREKEENQSEFGTPRYELDDFIGKDGLERTMEKLLRGVPGIRTVEMSVLGGPGTTVPGTEIPSSPGKNIQLTIDLELQRAVSQILQAGITFSNEDRRAIAERDPNRPFKKASGAGCVVAIDPRNGEVLAMVSFPHFDNQLFVDGISQRKYAEYISDESNKPLVDRALRGIYPPGSTCKMFMAAAALEEGKIDTNTTFNCTGAIRVPPEFNEAGGNFHPCWLTSGHETLDIFGAIERSCDVFFYNTGTPKQRLSSRPGYLHYYDVFDYGTGTPRMGESHDFSGLGIQLILKHLKDQFWFGQTTGIDLPTEDPSDNLWRQNADVQRGWSAGDTINVSIGQGEFLTTPLQLAVNLAAIANRGTVYKPQLVREAFDDARTEVESITSTVLRKLSLKSEVFDVVLEGLRRVVQEPTGTAFQNADQSSKWALTNPEGETTISIAGKTGTAELGEADELGNYDRQHAWFTCFAPFDKPEIAVAVIIEDGGEGSSYAVPVADRVLRAYFESTGARPRGRVLRAESPVTSFDQPVLAPSAAFPAPGLNAVPGAQPQD